MSELPQTVRDLRVQVATAAARAGHVFDRTVTTGPTPMPRQTVELNLVAHVGYIYGFALAEVLRRIEGHDPVLAEALLHLVNDMSMEGDDGRCVDVWPDVEQRLAAGGVGTPQWDAAPAATDPMPVFVIKAKDLLALEAVQAYRTLCDQAGLPGQAREVGKAWREMFEWRERNAGRVKLPDHEHVPVSG